MHFLHNPRLLLLETPWTSLNPALAVNIQNYILNNMPGTTVFVVSNEFDFAAKCDRVIEMAGGSIKISGTPSEVLIIKNLLNAGITRTRYKRKITTP